MSSISLDNAWLLLIAIPLVILIAVPFFITVRKDNRNGHNVASGILHIVLAIIIAFAAAGVTIETTLTETDVFVVADVSYSANRNLDVVDSYIENLQKSLPDNSQMGVICFGKGSDEGVSMVTPMGGEFTTVKNSGVDDTQTDIAYALKYAKARFKDNVIKRIVLITDAMQTGESGDSELASVVNDIIASNIYIDAIYLDSNISDDVAEVQLSEVSCSQTVYKGQETDVKVSVQSSQQQSATVSLYEVDQLTSEETLISRRSATLYSGTNEVEFTLSADRESGTYYYKVYVESGEDLNPYNNSSTFTQTVEGEVKVLFIAGSTDDRTAAKELFADSEVDVDYYICNASSSPSVPYTVAEVCAYDIIVLSGVDVTTINNYSMFIDSLEVAVSQLGKSLLTVGDLNLQNNVDDDALTKLSDMLPITYGNSVRDAKLYALVIDVSHSMAIGGGAVYGKPAAEAVVKLLNPDDYLVVVKFYGEAEVIYYGQVGSDDNVDSIIDTIENLETKQGTIISGGINALSQFASYNYSSKSILLVTDGYNAASDDIETVRDAVKNLYDNYGMGTSVIDVGLSSQYDETKDLLDAIANYGGGTHFYYTYKMSLDDILPTIQNELGDVIVESRSLVSVSYKNYNDDVLEGLKEAGLLTLDKTTLTYVDGYVVSSAKSSATTVLSVAYDTNKTVPLYSYWNYGNGTSASFTSTISGDWTSYWTSQGYLKTLFTDVVKTTTPEERVDTPYTVTVEKDSSSCTVELTPIEVKSGAQVTVTVTAPDGTQTVLNNVIFDSTAYTGSFNLADIGTYTITVNYAYKTESYESNYYVDVSYLAEYDSFTLYDASLLYKVIGSDGTVSEDGALTIENDESEIAKQTVSLTIPLLIAAISLFAVDIVIRKLKWNDIVSLFRKVGGRSKA